MIGRLDFFYYFLLIDVKRDSFLPSGLWIVLFWLPAETLSLKRLPVTAHAPPAYFSREELQPRTRGPLDWRMRARRRPDRVLE